MGTVTARGLELLRLAHGHPRLTRAQAAAMLGASSGTIAGLVSALMSAGLVDERPADPTGARGRPTRELVAHPAGPLVLGGVVTHEAWRVSAVELGGAALATEEGSHGGGNGEVLVGDLRAAAAGLADRFPGRVQGVGLALPGVVRGTRLVDAPLLGWRDLDLAAVWPQPGRSTPSSSTATGDGLLVVGNDATLAAVGEARRGAATEAAVHLHLLLDAGLGGAVTLGGTVLQGAHGLGGEFGHMPFGDPAARCPCGALGCWTTSVGAGGLARALGEPLPRNAVTYAREVLHRASEGEAAALRATADVARSLGRGVAGLVNALDVDLVTLGGLAPLVSEVAPEPLREGLTDGLMGFRRGRPPRVVSAALGDDGPQTGAAEQVWTELWERL